MTLQIYNSLSRIKEPFHPVHEGEVHMYVCGMTVYSDTHIGHARTYLAFDIIRRYLEYKGYKVTYIQNITDVDDKIIAAAQQQGKDPLEYSQYYGDRCLQDLDDLGIRRADSYPKASETIPAMIEMIQQIIKKGHAYEADGDVYFDVHTFPEYGKLSGQNVKDMRAGARIQPDEKKKNPLDFALWKQTKPGEPSWMSPWGEGRPGWHIECSAMSSKYLGLPFDIHGGGLDLQFPHHENEIAQAEAATGKSFAKYWMHIGLLTVNGEKMSKSLGNIVNVRDLLKKRKPESLRFFFAQAQYRSPPDFSDKALDDAEKALDRLYRCKEKLVTLAEDASSSFNPSQLTSDEKQYIEVVDQLKTDFEAAMDDDFNTPQAIAVLFEFVSNMNRLLEEKPLKNSSLAAHALEVFTKIGNVLTLFQDEASQGDSAKLPTLKSLLEKHGGKQQAASVEQALDALLSLREQARKQKQWDVADAIRDDLSKIGFEIQDTDTGPVWRKM